MRPQAAGDAAGDGEREIGVVGDREVVEGFEGPDQQGQVEREAGEEERSQQEAPAAVQGFSPAMS